MQQNQYLNKALKEAEELIKTSAPIIENATKLIIQLKGELSSINPEAVQDINKMEKLAKEGNSIALLELQSKIMGKYANKDSKKSK